jgi:serine/threonine protein kinase
MSVSYTRKKVLPGKKNPVGPPRIPGEKKQPNLLGKIKEDLPVSIEPISIQGATIGNYKVMNAIGKGGFGVVYKGINMTTGQTVAIKSQVLRGMRDSHLEQIQVVIFHIAFVFLYD